MTLRGFTEFQARCKEAADLGEHDLQPSGGGYGCGSSCGRSLEMGWAEQWELGGTSHSPPARWVSLSPQGRKVIDRYLRLKL